MLAIFDKRAVGEFVESDMEGAVGHEEACFGLGDSSGF